MRFLRQPATWAVMLAAVFAFTISGGSPRSLEAEGGGELPGDLPIDASLALVPMTAPERGVTVSAPAHAAGVGEPARELPGPDSLVAGGTPLPLPQEFAQVGGPDDDEFATASTADTLRPLIMTYDVRSGETLSQIAERFGIRTETILASNDIANPNVLQAGQKLKILAFDGALHRVQAGESLWEIARMYRVDMDEIIAANNLVNPDRIRPAQELVIPGVQAADIGSSIRSERLVSADGRLLRAFSWPVQARISSRWGMRWGRMHHGIDLAVITGTPVRAAAAGRVTFSGWNGGYGYLIVIDHGQNVETRYGHNSRLVAKVGDYVRRGDIVAYSGNTGNSTGPHVHFEIRYRGNSVNPLDYLR